MNAHDRDMLIRAALTPRDDVHVPQDLSEDIYRTLQTTAQRRSGALWPIRWLVPAASRGLWLVFIVSLLLAGLALALATRPPVPSLLPLVTTFHGGPERTGVMPGPGPVPPVAIGWQVRLGGPVTFSLMPLTDGRVVWVGDGSGALTALNAETGANLWSAPNGSPITGSPVIVNGLLVAGADDGTVVALDVATGEERWQFSARAAVRASLVATGESIYAGADDGTVFALDPATGALQWEISVGGPVTRGPAIIDGVMYVGATGGRFSAIDLKTHDRLWMREFGPGGLGTPAVANGAVYTTTGLQDYGVPHELVALDVRDGSVLWKFSAPIDLPLFVGAVDEDFVYAVSEDFNVYALDIQTGEQRWLFGTQGSIGTVATLVDDAIYVSSADGAVYALDRMTGQERWRVVVEGTPTIPVVVGGRVIVGTDLGEVIAITGEPPPEP